MFAIQYTSSGARWAPAALAAVPEGWVRLRVELAGVCRTDVAAARGELGVAEGRVLGHELVGRVEETGVGVSAEWRGRRVSVRPRLDDGRFLGLDLDGAFATWLVVPDSALVLLSERLSPERAAFVEPVAACLAVLKAPLRGEVGMDGHGRIAALTERILALHGHRVVRDPSAPVDVLIHTSAQGLPDLSRVRAGGVVVIKSRPARPMPVDLRAVTERELQLVGVCYGAFEEAARLLETGELDVSDLLGPTVPMAAFDAVFHSDGEGLKHFLVPEVG